MFQNQMTVIFCILAIGKCAVVIDERCDFTDHECLISMYQDLLKKTADSVPDMNIPRLDPMHLCNAVASLPNSFKITMIKGTVTGLKNCIFDDVEIHHEENFRITYNLTCSVEINATVKVEVPKSLMEELAEKYHLYLDVPFEFERRNDDIYLCVSPLDIYHDASDLAKFTIKDLDEDSKVNGEIISNYIQKKAVELNLMFPITEKVGEFFQIFEEALTAKIPANKFFKDELSIYVKSA